MLKYLLPLLLLLLPSIVLAQSPTPPPEYIHTLSKVGIRYDGTTYTIAGTANGVSHLETMKDGSVMIEFVNPVAKPSIRLEHDIALLPILESTPFRVRFKPPKIPQNEIITVIIEETR